MSVLTLLISLLFYAAVLVLVIGVANRIRIYWRTPSPLVIPTTPAPLTRTGVAARLFGEVVFFQSLFRGNKWTWVLGWLFHFGMLLVLLRHLRYFTDPIWWWVDLIQWIGVYAGFAMVAGLAGLLLRRLVVERIRYISAPSDHLMLLLLLGIGVSGLMMKYLVHTDIVSLKQFTMGLITFDWQPIPADPLLVIHLLMVATLMIIFPFSKLLHAPGLFFSPTRNMRDTPRERRNLAGWAAKLDKTRSSGAGE